MNSFKLKALFVAVLAGLALSGCAMSEAQLKALGPGDKAVCFHARCDSLVCGGKWSTTTSGAAASDGKVPKVGEQCQIGAEVKP
jgi:hypothetical protein